MGIRVSILVGLSSAAVFFIIQKYLLSWPYPLDVFMTLSVMAVSTVGAILISRRSRLTSKKEKSLISNNKVGNNLHGDVDGLEANEGLDKVMSENKVTGNAEFKIKNTKL